MSLIVAASIKGHTVLAGDCGSWSDHFAVRTPVPKVFRVGRALVGLVGRADANHAIHFAELPQPEDGEHSARYVIERLAPAMRERTALTPVAEGQPWGELGGLIALDGWVFDLVAGSVCVLLMPGEDGAFARGAPQDVARGALAAARRLCPEMTAAVLAEFALETAERHTDACLGPFTYLTDPHDPEDAAADA